MGHMNQGARILIVDDIPNNVQVLGTILSDHGYTLNIAQNGEQALALVRKVSVDLILLDILMPVMDGFETCRRLKENPDTRDIPVIFLTAFDEKDKVVEGLALGAVDYITKPFESKEVIARIERHLTLYFRIREMSLEHDTFSAFQEDRIARWTSAKIFELIEQGESEYLEFKSTVRCNLRTTKVDKAVELAWLKTVVAFLNTKGGTLLIGIGDDGSVLGLGNDRLGTEDKLLLHVNNLIKQHIGLEFTPFIHFGLTPMGEDNVLVVQCQTAVKPVFLAENGDENFYIRVGPGSRKLSSREVLEYLDVRSTLMG